MLQSLIQFHQEQSVNPHTLSWCCLAASFSAFCCQLQPINYATSFGEETSPSSPLKKKKAFAVEKGQRDQNQTLVQLTPR
jgi:hypothetical protein